MSKINPFKGAYLVCHKCHDRVSALRFAKCRKWYVQNLRITAKKYGVSIINYLVARDGVYILCEVADPKIISTMMQILQSSASKKFASKRGGESSMWRGRFSVTLVCGEIWIRQCMLLLDLHMIATKHFIHPAEWKYGGWQELAGTKRRYKVISTVRALNVWGPSADEKKCRAEYVSAVETCCLDNSFGCLETWTKALAVGSSGWINHLSISISSTFRSIDNLPQSALPQSYGDVEAVSLTVSLKRRRGYLDRILQRMNCADI